MGDFSRELRFPALKSTYRDVIPLPANLFPGPQLEFPYRNTGEINLFDRSHPKVGQSGGCTMQEKTNGDQKDHHGVNRAIYVRKPPGLILIEALAESLLHLVPQCALAIVTTRGLESIRRFPAFRG